jgi:MraZ protein
MFRGFEQAKIDEKGRLKIPAAFRERLVRDFGPEVFLTVLREHQLCIFPLKVWEEKEQLLLKVPDSMPEKQRFIMTANYYGAEKAVDEQGRLPLPQHLRDKVGLDADVAVMGGINMLVVMDRRHADRRAEEEFPSPAVFEKLQSYGI